MTTAKPVFTIRPATPDDAEAVRDIYAAYIVMPDLMFTINVPTIEFYREKIIRTLQLYPFYVAESENGEILGFTCGNPLRPHDAYIHDVELSIAVSPNAPKRSGIGSSLEKKLIETLAKQGFQYAYAVVVDTNIPSIRMHESLGFEQVGHFAQTGYKQGEWRGIVWLRKQIGTLPIPAPEIIPFPELLKMEEQA